MLQAKINQIRTICPDLLFVEEIKLKHFYEKLFETYSLQRVEVAYQKINEAQSKIRDLAKEKKLTPLDSVQLSRINDQCRYILEVNEAIRAENKIRLENFRQDLLSEIKLFIQEQRPNLGLKEINQLCQIIEQKELLPLLSESELYQKDYSWDEYYLAVNILIDSKKESLLINYQDEIIEVSQ